MNACIIAYTFYEVDFRVSRYADALVEEGYKVDVFALRRKEQARSEKLNGATIYHLQERDYNEKGLGSFLVKMILFWIKVFFAILAKQFQYRYQLVHIHNPPDFLVFAAIVPKLLGAKIIFDMHENLPEFYCAKFKKDHNAFLVKLLLLCEKMTVKYANFTIVAHDLLRERVIKRDNITDENCVALLNYPSRDFFSTAAQEKDEEEFRIVYPGTISHQHGIDIAIKAMAIVKQECKNAKLEIYGRSNNPTYHRHLKELIDDLGLNDTVLLRSVVPYEEIRNILSKAGIGVVPKRGGVFGSEAFSTKILEFMAAGLPVVLSRTKIDEYYFDDSMVKFFEPENETDMARCIIELLQSPEKRESLVKSGNEFIKNNNWEIKSKMYLDVVSKLLNHSGTEKTVSYSYSCNRSRKS